MCAAEQGSAEGSVEGSALAALLHEARRFDPPPDFAAQANAGPGVYREAGRDPLAWWAEQAGKLDGGLPGRPGPRLGGALRPLVRGRAAQRLGELRRPPRRGRASGDGSPSTGWASPRVTPRTITYADLLDMVCQAANALTELGVAAGDRVAIYLPMIPEAVVAMLACARLGRPALGRLRRVLRGGAGGPHPRCRRPRGDHRRRRFPAGGGVGAQGERRPGARAVPRRAVSVLVVRRTGQDVAWRDGRDLWWHDVVDRQSPTHEPEAFDAEQPLYIMYTSGTTAKPKGILHTTGRLPGPQCRRPTAWSSTSSRSRTSSGPPPTSGG